MRLEWIEDILAVSEMGSFNAAAEARFLTPSAFTRRIRTIEEMLGCELFDRSKKPVELRRHVRDCLPELRDAAVSLKRVRGLLSEPDTDTNQRVSMICQHALTASVVPTLLSHPILGENRNVRIKTGRKSECILALIRRDADFALIYQTQDDHPEIDVEYCDQVQLGSEVFVPVIQTDLLLQLQRKGDSNRLPMINYPSSVFLGEVLRKLLLSHPKEALQLVNVAETGLSLAVVEYVKRGIGVGWLPRAIVSRDLETGLLQSMEDRLPGFTLNVTLLRMTGELPRLAEDFWAAMEAPDALDADPALRDL